jgi:hypothetical protein
MNGIDGLRHTLQELANDLEAPGAPGQMAWEPIEENDAWARSVALYIDLIERSNDKEKRHPPQPLQGPHGAGRRRRTGSS